MSIILRDNYKTFLSYRWKKAFTGFFCAIPILLHSTVLANFSRPNILRVWCYGINSRGGKGFSDRCATSQDCGSVSSPHVNEDCKGVRK